MLCVFLHSAAFHILVAASPAWNSLRASVQTVCTQMASVLHTGHLLLRSEDILQLHTSADQASPTNELTQY